MPHFLSFAWPHRASFLSTFFLSFLLSLTLLPMPAQKFNVAVIGAGPAGLTAVGQLLDVSPALHHILWIDPSFTAGRLHLYPKVPSNTKVKLFKEFVYRSQTLQSLNQKESLLERIFGHMDPEAGCELSCAADMVVSLSQLIQKHVGHRVSMCRGMVEKLNWHSKVSPFSHSLIRSIIIYIII